MTDKHNKQKKNTVHKTVKSEQITYDVIGGSATTGKMRSKGKKSRS